MIVVTPHRRLFYQIVVVVVVFRYEVKVLGEGVHQLIINKCAVLDAGKVECTCADLKTNAKLEVKKKEEKPEVDADDGDSEDGRLKGKYKGRYYLRSPSHTDRHDTQRLWTLW